MSTVKNLDLIKSNDLFKGVDFPALKFPYHSANLLNLREGELIYTSGEPAEYIYLILQGEVKVKQIAIKRLFFKCANEFFGESEILTGLERNSSAVVNVDCQIYKLESSELRRMLNDSSSLRAKLLFDQPPENTPEDAAKSIPEINVHLPFEVNKTEPLKIDVSNVENIKPIHKDIVDIEKVRISHYQPEPDLDSIIQNKYLKHDDRKLKNQLVDDKDDSGSWIITEDSFDSDSNDINIQTEQTKPEPVKLSLTETTTNIIQKEPIHSVDLIPSRDTKQTADDILKYLMTNLNSDCGAFYKYNEENHLLLELTQTFESTKKDYKSSSEGITGLVVKSKEIRIAVSFLNDINYSQEVDRPNNFVGDTIIFIPMLGKSNSLLGILQIGCNENIFTKEDENKIKKISSYCSGIFEQSLDLSSAVIENNSEIKIFSEYLSSDIKAPLLKIKHLASVLSKSDLPEELSRINSSQALQINSLLDVIQAIIDFSEKTIKVKMEILEFDEVLDSFLESISDFIESKNILLYKKLGCKHKVKLDRRKFYSACYYISRYSAYCMKNGGKIHFSSYSDGSSAILNIKDENKLIQPGHISKIFDADYSAGNNNIYITSSMAISKFILESMNASISVHSSDSGLNYLVSIPILP